MARSFAELKQTSPERLAKLRAVMRLNMGTHKRIRLRRAGCEDSNTLLHDDVAKRHARLLQDDYNKRWGKLSRAGTLERLRFMTVLHSVARLNKRETIRAIERMENDLRRVFKGSGARLLGAVEVEIVNIALLRKIGSLNDDETRKLNVLENIRVAAKLKEPTGVDSGVLVHFHGIVDLMSKPEPREVQLRERMKKIAAWQRSPYQVEIKRLFETPTVQQNLRDIASYLTKGGNERLRYNAGFGRDLAEDLDAKIWRAGTGRADKGGETVDDERGLTLSEIKFLDDIWHELMCRRRNKRGYIVRLG